jgi:hypothetical protein
VLRLLHELEEGHLPADEAVPGESLPTPVPRLPRPEDSPQPESLAGGPSNKPPRRRTSGRRDGARRPRR